MLSIVTAASLFALNGDDVWVVVCFRRSYGGGRRMHRLPANQNNAIRARLVVRTRLYLCVDENF